MTDEEVVSFLDAMSSYETAKLDAAQKWRAAFLGLSRARLEAELHTQQHDPAEPASTRVEGLVLTAASAPPPSFGAWPPSSVRQARQLFLAALQAELRAAEAEVPTRPASAA